MKEKIKKPQYSYKSIIKALEEGSFTKIICGASNTSRDQVERISLIYSLCGVDVIDISPQKGIYSAAMRGIIKAAEIASEKPDKYPNFIVPAIMKSINVGQDKHFRKASFNIDGCIQCLECVKECQSGAITEEDGKRVFADEKCYGCASCVEACQHNIITMISNPFNPDDNKGEIGSFDAIEMHTGKSSIEEVKTFLEVNKNILKNAAFTSVSVDSSRFNKKELIEYVNSIIKLFDKKIIIQIDGISMRGGTKNSATLQTIAAAAMLLEAKVNAHIQLSGGTNYITPKIVELASLNISGIAYGTFAKKIILSYIEEYDEKEFMGNLHKITAVAEVLTKRYRNYN